MRSPAAERQLLARAVAESVYQALWNALREPERDEYWREYADRMERKFTTEYGRHYSFFLADKPCEAKT